jgi:hypothetical protein
LSAFATSLRLAPIDRRAARAYLDARHPLGAGAPFSLALGVFWEGRLEGVMTWGAPVVNNAGYRYGLRPTEMLELRKFLLSDVPPPHSESRCLAVAARLLRRRYPGVRLLLTYCESDEAATAYRAAGWLPQTAYTYVREGYVDGKLISLRHINSLGGIARLRAAGRLTGLKMVSRRKWILPLDPALAARLTDPSSAGVAQRSARAASSREAEGSTPIHPLHPDRHVEQPQAPPPGRRRQRPGGAQHEAVRSAEPGAGGARDAVHQLDHADDGAAR